MGTIPDRFMAGGSLAAARGNSQDVRVAAVGMKRARENGVRFGAVVLKQRAAGAVAEQDAGVAVGPVHDHGELVGAADQHVAVFLGKGAHEGETDFERGDEPGACGGKVEAERLSALEMVLNQRTSGVNKPKFSATILALGHSSLIFSNNEYPGPTIHFPNLALGEPNGTA